MTPEYNRNRKIVMRMSHGLCERCWILFKRVTPAKECDHLVGRAQGGTHKLDNLWALCGSRNDPGTCHHEKSHREAGTRFDVNQPFIERIDPMTGWAFDGDRLADWQSYIVKRNAAGTLYFDET